MKRFDDGQDIIFRLSGHGDQEGGSSVHPRMDEIQVAESIRRQPDGRHNYIALLIYIICQIIKQSRKIKTKQFIYNYVYSIDDVTDEAWMTLDGTSRLQYGIVDLEDCVTNFESG
jgi:hypothetical protein